MKSGSDEHLHQANEKQGELFPEFRITSIRKPKHFIRQDIALRKKIALKISYENLILLFIAFIMLLVIFFSLGVERGKRIALRSNRIKIIEHSENIVEKNVADKTEKIKVGPFNAREPSKIKLVKNNTAIKQDIADTTAKPYTIQVIAVKKQKNAKKEIQRLKKEGYEAFLIPAKEWLQVCVGKYVNKADAKKDLANLRERYPTCYLRKIK
jgi:cell division septation protein DedD